MCTTPVWTATARYADIVLPATTTAERDDIGAAPTDPLLVAMQRYAEPWGDARDDYEIFAAIAEHLGIRERFTESQDQSRLAAPHLRDHPIGP